MVISGSMKHVLGSAALYIIPYNFTFSFTASLPFPAARTNTMNRTVALAFLASFTCLKSVSAAQNLFARQGCEALFCSDNLWKTFGAFFMTALGLPRNSQHLPILGKLQNLLHPRNQTLRFRQLHRYRNTTGVALLLLTNSTLKTSQ